MSQSRSVLLKWFFVIFVLVSFFTVSFILKVFTYQHISCQYGQENCSEPVLAELHRVQGSSFFSHHLEKTLEKIKKSNPEISSIDLRKSFPNSVSIHIQERPLVLKILCSDVQLGISDQGYIQASALLDTENIPSIQASESVCSSLQQKETLDQGFQAQLILFLNEMHANLSDHEIKWDDSETVTLTNPQQQRVIISTNQLSHHVQVYQLLVSHQQLPANWKSLDLRFQKAVIQTE